MTEETRRKKTLILLAKIAGALLLLTVVVHTIAVLVTGSGVRKAKEAMKAKGYPMTAADIIPKKIPDEQNAAVELKKVFGLMTLGGEDAYSPEKSSGDLVSPFTDIIKVYDSSGDFQQPLTDEQVTTLAKSFVHKDAQRVFELLTAAAAKRKCGFDRHYEQGPNLMLPELQHFRNICRILGMRAKLESQLGNREVALEKVRESLIIGNAPANEPILISQLVRIANLSISLQALRFVSTQHKLSEAEVADLRALSAPYSDPKFFLNSMHGERLLFGQWFFENDEAIDTSAFGEGDGKILRFYSWYPFRPFFNSDYSTYLNCMRINTEHLEKDLKTAMAEDIDKKMTDQMGKLAIISRMVAPALSRIRIKMASARAMIQMTEIAVACNQYRHDNGKNPDSLEALGTNPLEEATGKPFLYKKTEEGVAIYSACDKYGGRLEITVDGKKKKVLGVKLMAPTGETK